MLPSAATTPNKTCQGPVFIACPPFVRAIRPQRALLPAPPSHRVRAGTSAGYRKKRGTCIDCANLPASASFYLPYFAIPVVFSRSGRYLAGGGT